MLTCPHCHRPLIQIDRYGERPIGCIECNLFRDDPKKTP